MAAPVTPQEFKDVIPEGGGNICSKFLKVIRVLPILLWKLVNWMFNADGTVSDDFKAAIGLTVGGLAAPTNVAATDGTYTNKVTITWSASSGASSYQVWRNTIDDSATASQVGSPSSTTFDDSTVTAGTVYWYWVKAVNAGGTSSFSTSNSGYAAATSTSPIDYGATQNVTVPAGWTTVKIEVWGDGGGGGGVLPFSTVPFYGGGGGGSGGYKALTGIAVTSGQTLELTIGAGGAGSNTTNGASGSGTAVVRSSVVLISVGGGGGGGAGTSSAGGAAGLAGTGDTGGNVGQVGQAAGVGGTGGAAVGTPASWGAGGTGRATMTNGSRGNVRITPNG